MPPFLVRLLVGALLPVALPLPVTLLLRVPSFLVAVMPLAPAARGAPLSPMHGPVGAPPPFVRLLVGSELPVAPPLSVAPLLCAPSSDIAVVPPALPRLRLLYHLSLGLWELLYLLCAGSWALRCRCGFAWACGRPSALHASPRGRPAACHRAAFVCSRAPCVVSRGCCATSHSVCLGAPLLLTPRLASARVNLVRRPAGVVLPCAPPLILAHLLCVLLV